MFTGLSISVLANDAVALLRQDGHRGWQLFRRRRDLNTRDAISLVFSMMLFGARALVLSASLLRMQLLAHGP